MIGSKEGYVMYIIRIFKQYWGYFERLSGGQQPKNPWFHFTLYWELEALLGAFKDQFKRKLNS